jgi:murein DD-endopeptidase MepM/ murein hydrolase activator NlpD
MRLSGSPRPRVAHARPLTPEARASRAAIAVRVADRASRRQRPTRLRLAIPIPLVLIVGAVLLVAGQPPARASGPTTTADGRTDMDLSARLGRPSTAGPIATPGSDRAGSSFTSEFARPRINEVVEPISGYRWPVEHARITQGFGPSSGGLFVVDGKRFHDGIDLANFCGAPVVAAHDGVVIGAGRHVNRVLGWTGDIAAYDAHLTAKHLWGTLALTVVIDDGNGYRSVYVHFHRVDVKVGQVVHAGQQIGLEGSTGHATGCHLHYGIFSSTDPGQWPTTPTDVERYHLPTGEIAHIDPLLFLPALAVGHEIWGWGAHDIS